MSLPEGFFEVHRGLEREGPGLPEDVHWALSVAGTAPDARVLDAGCGPGADAETLAQALPAARIEAVDGVAHFIDEARARLVRFGDRVTARHGDMAEVTGPYDLIWCAGALYFLGVSEGLARWRAALAPGGRVAFSEPVLPEGEVPPAVAAFWEGEANVGTAASIRDRVTDAGYRVLGERRIAGAAWVAYYAPMEARIAELKAQGRGEELAEAIADSEAEIARWRSAPEDIAYLLLVVAPA